MPAYKLLSFDDDGAIKAGIEHDGFVFNLASEIVFHGPESALTACRWIRRSDAGVILSWFSPKSPTAHRPGRSCWTV